jgi:hypothetical protein
MSDQVLLATKNGLRALIRDRRIWREDEIGLDGINVTALDARGGTILAGTTNGIRCTPDGGKTWREASDGLAVRHVRWIAYHPDVAGLVLAGTEPASIFVSRNSGTLWRECPEVSGLRDQFHWMLPYSPEAGCVRGFAFHGSRVYAAVEVGGALVSEDGGESWRLTDGSDGIARFGRPPKWFIHPDVHSIKVHPFSRDLVFAATGGGFYRSLDGGQTWQLLYDCYCRATWVDAQDANHIILGPASGVDSNGRIEESRDGGATWHTASNGLPVPWRNHMVELFAQAEDELFAVLSNGELIVSRCDLPSWEWRRVLPSNVGVNAAASFV